MKTINEEEAKSLIGKVFEDKDRKKAVVVNVTRSVSNWDIHWKRENNERVNRKWAPYFFQRFYRIVEGETE